MSAIAGVGPPPSGVGFPRCASALRLGPRIPGICIVPGRALERGMGLRVSQGARQVVRMTQRREHAGAVAEDCAASHSPAALPTPTGARPYRRLAARRRPATCWRGTAMQKTGPDRGGRNRLDDPATAEQCRTRLDVELAHEAPRAAAPDRRTGHVTGAGHCRCAPRATATARSSSCSASPTPGSTATSARAGRRSGAPPPPQRPSWRQPYGRPPDSRAAQARKSVAHPDCRFSKGAGADRGGRRPFQTLVVRPLGRRGGAPSETLACW
jgi:hypothetical protein